MICAFHQVGFAWARDATAYRMLIDDSRSPNTPGADSSTGPWTTGPSLVTRKHQWINEHHMCLEWTMYVPWEQLVKNRSQTVQFPKSAQTNSGHVDTHQICLASFGNQLVWSSFLTHRRRETHALLRVIPTMT